MIFVLAAVASPTEGNSVATWLEVKTYIKSNYVIQSETELTMTMEFDTGGGRSQLVFVMGIEGAGDMSSLRFFSPFAEVSQISATQFAGLADGVVFGLARLEDFYGVVHNSFLADLDASEINTPLMAVTSQADKMEKQLGLGDDL
jgi:hypothetical protein